jgi:integrase
MHMLAANINIVYIRDFLGHEDISTTMIYSRADNRLKNEAINALAPKVTDDINLPDWRTDQELLSFLNSF